MRKEAENWLEQAKEDFSSAEANIGIRKYYVVAFLSQQCAEKALKALYIEKNRDSAKTHNLLELGHELKVPKGIYEALLDLNADYTVSRYPDAANAIPARAYSKSMALRKVKMAKEVLEWVSREIRK